MTMPRLFRRLQSFGQGTWTSNVTAGAGLSWVNDTGSLPSGGAGQRPKMSGENGFRVIGS